MFCSGDLGKREITGLLKLQSCLTSSSKYVNLTLSLAKTFVTLISVTDKMDIEMCVCILIATSSSAATHQSSGEGRVKGKKRRLADNAHIRKLTAI